MENDESITYGLIWLWKEKLQIRYRLPLGHTKRAEGGDTVGGASEREAGCIYRLIPESAPEGTREIFKGIWFPRCDSDLTNGRATILRKRISKMNIYHGNLGMQVMIILLRTVMRSVKRKRIWHSRWRNQGSMGRHLKRPKWFNEWMNWITRESSQRDEKKKPYDSLDFLLDNDIGIDGECKVL